MSETKEAPEGEIRGAALLQELAGQRNAALDRCASLMADNAVLQSLLKKAHDAINKKEPVVLRAVGADSEAPAALDGPTS